MSCICCCKDRARPIDVEVSQELLDSSNNSRDQAASRNAATPTSDLHVGISPPAKQDVGTTTADLHVGISPPARQDVGTTTADLHVGISPPARQDVGTTTADLHVGISPPARQDVGTTTADLHVGISPPARQDVRTTTSDLHVGISPPARVDVGTATSDLPVGISDTYIFPPARQSLGTSTPVLISQQDVASLDANRYSPEHPDDDGQTIPKTLFGDREREESFPSTAGGTTQQRLPQQESSADSSGSRAENAQERYIILRPIENSRSVECIDCGYELCQRLREKEEQVREKEEQVRRLERDIKDLREQFVRYVMRATDDLRESVRNASVTVTDQLLQNLAWRICQELGLRYISIDRRCLDVEFAPAPTSLTSPMLEGIKEIKEKIENILKNNLPEDIREGLHFCDPVQCTQSTAVDNEVQCMAAQIETSPKSDTYLPIPYLEDREDNPGFIPRHPSDRPEDKRVWIRAMATLPDGRLLATDAFNMSLKVISINSPNSAVMDCFPLGVKPYGVAVLDCGQTVTVVVTTEETKSIFLLEALRQDHLRQVATQKQYRGVGPGHDGNIVVSCSKQTDQEACVDVIAQDGTIIQTLHTFTGVFQLAYLTVSENGVFVSDKLSNSIYYIRTPRMPAENPPESLTHEEMKWPRQVSVSHGGSVVVACSDSECVLRRPREGDWQVVLTGRENGDSTGRRKASALAILGNDLVVAWGKFGDCVLKRHLNII